MSQHVARRGLSCALLLAACPFLIGAVDAEIPFAQRLLAEHNAERLRLGLPPLKWNAALAAGAKEWSDHLAATGKFEHSPDAPGTPPLGENIWGGTPHRFAPERMVQRWIAEKEHFKPGVFPANSRTGSVQDVSHYTQIVWRDTTEVGCSLSRGAREEILVCRYSAPGNVIGSRPF